MRFLVFLISLTSIAHATETVILPLKAVPIKISIEKMVQVDETYVAGMIGEGLFNIGEGFEIIPVLAEKVSWSNDGKVLNIKLRANASFSDGSKVTANSVLYSLHKCIKRSESALSLALESIQGFESFKNGQSKSISGLVEISESELEIRTIKRSPLLPDTLTFNNCFIFKGNAEDILKDAIGTGPYTVKRATADGISLQRRANYYRPFYGPERVEFRATNDWGNFSSLKNWASLILTESDQGIDINFSRAESSEMGTYQLVFNNSKPPFNQKLVRQAIENGIDFSMMAEAMNWSKERMQSSLFPFGMRGFRQRALKRNIDLSRRQLAKSGYNEQKPLHFTIFISKSPVAEIEKNVWPGAFSKLPIKVNVVLLEQSEFVKVRNSGNYDAVRVIKFPGTVDGNRLLASYISGSPYNTARSNLPKCDDLIRKSSQNDSPDDRYRSYLNAEKCLLSEVILIPLATTQAGFAYFKKPWITTRKNRYSLLPYDLRWWVKNEK